MKQRWRLEGRVTNFESPLNSYIKFGLYKKRPPVKKIQARANRLGMAAEYRAVLVNIEEVK